MDVFYYDTGLGIVSGVIPMSEESIDDTIQHLARDYPSCIYFYATLVAGEVKNEDTPVSPGGTEHDVRKDGSVAVDPGSEKNHM